MLLQVATIWSSGTGTSKTHLNSASRSTPLEMMKSPIQVRDFATPLSFKSVSWSKKSCPLCRPKNWRINPQLPSQVTTRDKEPINSWDLQKTLLITTLWHQLGTNKSTPISKTDAIRPVQRPSIWCKGSSLKKKVATLSWSKTWMEWAQVSRSTT